MSRPGSAVFLYDNLRTINRVDAMLLGGAFLLLVPFRTFTFNGRYAIMEDVGPWHTVYMDMKIILLVTIPLTLLTIISVVFNAMTLRNVIMRRRKGSSGDTRIGDSAHMNKYLLLAISSSGFMLFGDILGLYPTVKEYLLQMNDHEQFPHVFVPISEVMKTIHEKVFWTRTILEMSPDSMRSRAGFFFSIPVAGMYFFAFFGLGKEARKTHRDNIKWIAQLLGWKWQNKEASGSSDPETPHFSQRWRFFSIFRRVVPSSRNKVLVTPFEPLSNNSSQSFERVSLDSVRHSAGKGRVADGIDESRRASLSMHKSPFPPSQSLDTSINEASQPHGAVTSGKRRTSPTSPLLAGAVTSGKRQPSPTPPLLAADSTNVIVQNGLHSLSHPQRKPPIPPLDRHASSINNAQQSRPQFAPLPVPPPAYSPETSGDPQYLL
ncbi:hypothetical protein CPB86DRAFT_798181 [Serendipita vermifera]|nr:hypothetical protein CPB86DRAFT_798181 [Serendipita vermifera]